LRKLLEDARREFMTEIHSNSEDDIAADPNLQRRVKLVGRIDRALKTRGV
jgi:Flp pilus assembly protein TadD